MLNLPRLLAPANWSDFYGHTKEKHIILRSITDNGLLFPNAFYLSGETGTGKTTLVNLIIRSFLCSNPGDYELEGIVYPKVNPCGQCDICKQIKDFRSAESSYTNIKLIQEGKGDGEKIKASVHEALRLSMVPPIDFSSGRKDYRFLIFDEWQLFDKHLRQTVLLKAEDALPTTIFIFLTMAEEELGERRRTALVSRGLGIELRPFTEQQITSYLLDEVNPRLPESLPKLKEPEAVVIAKKSKNSLRMSLSLYGGLFRYDMGLEYIRPATVQYFLSHTDAEDRLELWSALLTSNWKTFNACLDRFSQVYKVTELDQLALDLIEDISSAMKQGRGKHEDQILALNTLFRFISNHRTYRLSDFLVVLGNLDLGVIR